MKKILFLAISIFLITGCSNDISTVEKPESSEEMLQSDTGIEQGKFSIASLKFDEKHLTPELKETLGLIQEAFDNGELEYKGVEDMGASGKRYKLAFTDEKIGPGVLISLSPVNNFLPEAMDSYERYAVQLDYFNEGIERTLHVEAGKISQGEFEKAFKDTGVQNELLKRLIARYNSTAIPAPGTPKSQGEWCDAPFGGVRDAADSSANLSDHELAELLFPVAQNSEVFFGAVLCDKRDEDGKIASFDIPYAVIGDLKKNRDEALKLLNETHAFLSGFQSDEASIKQKLISRMKDLKYVASMNGNRVTATDCISGLIASQQEECIDITAFIDPEEKTEKNVQFEFALSSGGAYTSLTEINGQIKNGEIVDMQNLARALKGNNRQNEGMKYLVEYHNKQQIQRLRDYDGGIMNPNDDIMEKLATQLEPVILASNMLIWQIDWNGASPGDHYENNNEIFILRVLPLQDLLLFHP